MTMTDRPLAAADASLPSMPTRPAAPGRRGSSGSRNGCCRCWSWRSASSPGTGVVVWNEIPHYILPGPGLVLQTLIKDWAILFDALLVTLQITLMALAVAVIGGVGLAILFNQSRWAEMSFYPYAVILQVTPVVVDRAADLHLCRQPDGGPAALRLDRGLLPDPRQHHAWPEIDRPQPDAT